MSQFPFRSLGGLAVILIDYMPAHVLLALQYISTQHAAEPSLWPGVLHTAVYHFCTVQTNKCEYTFLNLIIKIYKNCYRENVIGLWITVFHTTVSHLLYINSTWRCSHSFSRYQSSHFKQESNSVRDSVCCVLFLQSF